MRTILTEVNLETGLKVWKGKNWPLDLNNGLYIQLTELRVNGLDEHWWKPIVNHLSVWIANRPKSKKFIYARGIERLQELNGEYERILAACDNLEPNLETTSWETLSPLFAVANSIKGVDSPVFGSKLSHFIFPSAFPVIDNEVIGVDTKDYKPYWNYCYKQWTGSRRKQRLIERLKTIVGNEASLNYPWPTKITELCIIGNKLRNAAA